LGSSRRNRAFAALAAALLLLSHVARAQRARPLVLAGRLMRVRGADTTALARVRVIAHRVGQARQGPIDSMLTDARGGFRFVVRAPEAGAIYVVSTLKDGIGYFSEPVTPGSGAAAPLTLLVFDTSSAGPPLEVGTRNVVVTRGANGQGHRVLDIYQVQNSGTATRVAADSLGATFSVRLPSGITEPQSGASDIPSSAIRFEGNRALVAAPFPPGDKQVVISYTLPKGVTTFEVPLEQPTGEVDLMLEDSTAQPSAPLLPTDPVAIEGHTFRRYAATGIAAGSSFTVRFSSGSSRRTTLFAVIAAGALLLAGAAYALTRRAEPAPQVGAPIAADGTIEDESRERLVAQLAALDDRFSGRESDTPPEVWASYQTRRAALKAALSRRLAQG
jgi:hypothetical protein